MAVLEVFLQTLLAFAAILFYTRILGKEQVGQLTYFEYVTGITFGSIAAVLATDIGTQRSVLHFSGLTFFAALTFVVEYISLKSRLARKVLSGEPTILVHNGKILEDNFRKMRYNIDELNMQLRGKGIFNLQDVEYAILEPNGMLSVLPKSQKRNVTPEDLKIPTSYEGLQTELVVDGEIIFQNLRQLNLDENWLFKKLADYGVRDINDVSFAALDTKGQLYVDLKKDDLTTPVDISDNPEPPKK